ncbi:hypothetical protein VaNZ11_014947 [Volvox africanus]|uniref:Uncharacterized protein n=1 Tax=Volvox africanus TaxID=51714 RepID=A0ABQ5SKX4_9CHLO|nr:hypothetical protein VaNZ11_014947 [Volvox africanus]
MHKCYISFWLKEFERRFNGFDGTVISPYARVFSVSSGLQIPCWRSRYLLAVAVAVSQYSAATRHPRHPAGLLGLLDTTQLTAMSLGRLAVAFWMFFYKFLLFITLPEIAEK